ncbi:class I SAM-dependent methyltransferase [Chelativorans sp. YIM 93263]|uniref:class I SAM-dependent methyltransferase n=1 Tax=Chelativorans sp. YIM 93263 TaxID=2906648 RepID=UPI0023788280|nr:class I SAM-dependent methyltransferase [Chelativorans sp. YIM 93263]
MTALKDKILRLVEAAGPMSVADYMAICLFDPEHGYYTTREPFGRGGDFTTAPEISQMFGELVAAWIYAAWRACGAPRRAVIAEIGPGRGTLMKDMLRTLGRFDAGFLSGQRFALIETSSRLVDVQRKTLAGTEASLEWYSDVKDLPEGALFIIGNELFDALPIRQYVKTGSGWRERVVGESGGELTFLAGAGAPDPALLPANTDNAPVGAIVELSPARTALMDIIAERLARTDGAGLFIDYGYATPALGDTLQALRRHTSDDVLAHPGEADLTAHVDFSALGKTARGHGLAARVMPQGDFLLGLGLLERAGRLGAGKTPNEQERISGEVERLAGPEEMGTLFKALAVTPSTVTVPPFTLAD